MHERSLAEGILQMCENAAAREGCRRVTEVRVEIGALAGIEVEALSFCLEVVLKGASPMGPLGAGLGIPWLPGCSRLPVRALCLATLRLPCGAAWRPVPQALGRSGPRTS